MNSSVMKFAHMPLEILVSISFPMSIKSVGGGNANLRVGVGTPAGKGRVLESSLSTGGICKNALSSQKNNSRPSLDI